MLDPPHMYCRTDSFSTSYSQFLEIWSEDGVAAEPEDEMGM